MSARDQLASTAGIYAPSEATAAIVMRLANKPKQCPDNCACQQDDALTTPLDPEEFQ